MRIVDVESPITLIDDHTCSDPAERALAKPALVAFGVITSIR